MSAASTIRLTKPRISALILEATVAVVSLVLALWLLLWFINQRTQGSRIGAFYVHVDGVSAEGAPFQAADARLFSDQVQEAKPGPELNDKVNASIRGREPVFIYVSAAVPVEGLDAKGTRRPWIKDLIESIASSPGADVILALELSRIDTDRGLGVYGNAPYCDVDVPYSELAESIKGIPAKRRLFILTSAAPAQKSWSSDRLGHSIFAYYLREALKGEERSSDAKAPAKIRIQDLHRFVHDHVREWVRRNRHESIQTPMLLTALPDPGSSSLEVRLIPNRDPAVQVKSAPSSTEASASEAPAKSESPAKADVATTPKASEPGLAGPKEKDKDLEKLIVEWKQHDDLLQGKKPYRYLPGAWRTYQASLILAERRLRAAWFDRDQPGVLDRLQKALEVVENEREAINTRLDLWKSDENSFPFRSMIGEIDGAGKRELDRSLNYLTGSGQDAQELVPTKDRVAPTEPGKGPDKPRPGADAGDDAGPPLGLTKITPDTYLELQLLAWAHEFQTRFDKKKYFQADEKRGQTLRKLVTARADAERALDVDRRGVGWVTALVRSGDTRRRSIQDELLSGTSHDDPKIRWSESVDDVATKYRQARQWSETFRKARETWEAAAADLPPLVEWAVRRESFRSPSPSNSVPHEANRALARFEELAKLLQTEPIEEQSSLDDWFSSLSQVTDDAGTILKELHGQFEKEIDRLELEDPDWTALDAALRTPFIPSSRRKVLLERLRGIDEPPFKIQPVSNGDPGSKNKPAPDPGFWARAAGLSQLDLALYRIAHDPGTAEKASAGFKELEDAISQAKTGLRTDTNAETGPRQFPNFTAAVRMGAKICEGPDALAVSDTSRTPKQLGVLLPAIDRRARLLEKAEASEVDKAVAQYWQFGRYTALDFHFQRLQDDYADDRDLKDISTRIEAVVMALQIEDTSNRIRVARRPPKIRVDRTHLQLEKWQGDLVVTMERTKDRKLSIPPGRAFVGLVVPHGLQVADVPGTTKIPGKLESVGSAEPDSSETYRLVQRAYDQSQPFLLKVVFFYRGRVFGGDENVVEVWPDKSSVPVIIEISRDEDAWMRTYPGAKIAHFKDQFKDHQNTGFLHRGGSLDCVLTVTNYVPEEMRLACTIDLANPDAGAKTAELKPEELKLGPSGSGTDKQTVKRFEVSFKDAQPNEKRVLRVRLTAIDAQKKPDENKSKIIASLEVTFSQIGVETYMKIASSYIDNCEKPEHRIAGNCYVVSYKRLSSDQFTDPVSNSDWRCECIGKSESPNNDFRWIEPGTALGFHFYDQKKTLDDYKWSGQIETERVEGEALKFIRIVRPK